MAHTRHSSAAKKCECRKAMEFLERSDSIRSTRDHLEIRLSRKPKGTSSSVTRFGLLDSSNNALSIRKVSLVRLSRDTLNTYPREREGEREREREREPFVDSVMTHFSKRLERRSTQSTPFVVGSTGAREIARARQVQKRRHHHHRGRRTQRAISHRTGALFSFERECTVDRVWDTL